MALFTVDDFKDITGEANRELAVRAANEAGQKYDNVLDNDKMLKYLTPREEQVMRLYFGVGAEYALSLSEVAIALDISKPRVEVIKETALRKLYVNTLATLREFNKRV